MIGWSFHLVGGYITLYIISVRVFTWCHQPTIDEAIWQKNRSIAVTRFYDVKNVDVIGTASRGHVISNHFRFIGVRFVGADASQYNTCRPTTQAQSINLSHRHQSVGDGGTRSPQYFAGGDGPPNKKHTILRSAIEKFSGEGALPPHRLFPSGEGKPPPHTSPSSAPTAPRFSRLRRSTLAPSAPRSMVPPMLNRNRRPWSIID